ncbi:unnamed protein product [Brugia pahangi]|uniref:Uncharacterized protein n=1 Tax=Brugia pahangi TaxID=6280 RepID=A0A0N4TPR0_BRUPA|nr:unnamed protein product [Brugia pahangi]
MINGNTNTYKNECEGYQQHRTHANGKTSITIELNDSHTFPSATTSVEEIKGKTRKTGHHNETTHNPSEIQAQVQDDVDWAMRRWFMLVHAHIDRT